MNPAAAAPAPPRTLTGAAIATAQFRYYPYVMAAFVAILLLSNLIGASKPSYLTLPNGAQWAFGAGVLFFPVSYIIGDVLTEVYGYANARRVIWTGFAALIFMAFMAAVVVALPPAGRGRRPTNSCSAIPGGSCSPRSSPSGPASSPTPSCWRG